MSAFAAYKNIAYRVMSPSRLARAIDISVRFSLRRVSLLLPGPSNTGSYGETKTVGRVFAECSRDRGESLERSAERLVEGLRQARVWKKELGETVWYMK